MAEYYSVLKKMAARAAQYFTAVSYCQIGIPITYNKYSRSVSTVYFYFPTKNGNKSNGTNGFFRNMASVNLSAPELPYLLTILANMKLQENLIKINTYTFIKINPIF